MAPIEKEILRASATPQGLSVKGVADLASRMKVNRQRASAILMYMKNQGLLVYSDGVWRITQRL